MRTLLLLVLLITPAGLANAQTLISGSESAPELKIAGAGWEQYGGDMISHITFSDPVSRMVGDPVSTNGTTSTTWKISPKRSPVNCKALLLIENGGAKTVKAVYADYIFIDPQTRDEFLRYQFRTETKISPGRAKKISQDIYQKVGKNRKFFTPAKPAPELIMRTGEALFKVIVTRVEYSDGTSWQRP